MSVLVDRLKNEILSVDGLDKQVARERYINILNDLGMLYHFDDNPKDIMNGHTGIELFTPTECAFVSVCTNLLYDESLFTLAMAKMN